MSRLIDQLRESDYPDRSARDLTLEIGEWLEKNKRDDVFTSNPDFAQEYYGIKDEISRARRPGFGAEFAGSFGSAIDELQASGYALGALAAEGAQRIGIPGAEPVRNNLLRLMREQQAEAEEFRPSVPSLTQISGEHPFEDTARFLTYGAGTIGPSLLQSLAAAVAGAAGGSAVAPGPGTVTGAVGGAILGLAERKLAQKTVSKLLERGIATVTLEEAAKALPREAIVSEARRLALEYGAKGALALSSIGSEIGSIYAENPEAPGAAIGFGIPAGLLDILPETMIAGRILGAGRAVSREAASEATGYFRRFVSEAAKNAPLEGGTESAQTLLEIAAKKRGRGEPATFTGEDYIQALNAGVIGGIAGFAMSGGSALADPGARADPYAQLDERVVERLPLVPTEPAGPMQFGGEIPEADLISRRTLGPDAQRQLSAAERVGFEGFNPGEEAPYVAPNTGAGQPTALSDETKEINRLLAKAGGMTPNAIAGIDPQVELPKSVEKAIEAAEAAARAWEIEMTTPEPFPGEAAPEPAGPLELPAAQPPAAPSEMEQLRPPSEVVTDAPLANLVGTVVEYEGYRGQLVRDREGNFMVLPPTRETEKPFWVEVTGTGKNPDTLASAVGVVPTEPTMTPKPAPAVAVPGAPLTQATTSPVSKMPLTDLFPSDLVPRQDIAVPNRTQPGEVLAASAPAAPAVTAPAASPTVAPVSPTTPVVSPTAPSPVVVTRATDEQSEAARGNGVPTLPNDVPNIRRLRIFSQPEPRPETEEGPVPQPKTVESQALAENPLVELDKAVGKAGKPESNVVAVIVDRKTGAAYVRGAYRGAANVLYVDAASTRKGTAIGRGSTVSSEADFKGTDGRPATKLFAERLEDGTPRYTVWGVGELVSAKGPRNWNTTAAALNTHPGLVDAAKRYWTQTARRAKAGKRAEALPPAKLDIQEFGDRMAAWRRENPGEGARVQMVARIAEHAAFVSKGKGLKEEVVAAWAEQMAASIEEIARVQQRQAVRLSADYTVAAPEVVDLFRSILRALTAERDVDVAAFETGVMSAVDSAAQTMGLVITPEGRRKIVAFAVSSLHGPVNAETVLSLMHEVGHIITDGLDEGLRVAFQESVRRMAWFSSPDGRGRWLMNPRSLDIRLLANADPAMLSPEQRDALGRLSAEEIAAARRIDPADLIEEQMAEHLAQLGWDRSEARSVMQRFVRFVKDLLLRLTIAVQKALKGEKHVSPTLARAYVENRFLQFIHRDSAFARDRINDLMTWLGVPAKPSELIPVFPAGRDWDQRMQYVDVLTGKLIPVDHAVHTVDAQTAYLKASIDQAAQWVAEHPAGSTPDTPEIRFTQRANFGAPLSFTPTVQHNVVFAALNLEDEIYRRIQLDSEIGPLLPGDTDFMGDWLKIPERQLVTVRRTEAENFAGSQKDALSGGPVAFNSSVTVDGLPETEVEITDRDGKPIKVALTEAQDKALQHTIAAVSDTQRRVQRAIERDTDRLTTLERQRRKNPADFPEASLRELDELKAAIPLRTKIAERLNTERKRLESKFQPGDVVSIYGGSNYLTVPSADASEAAIRKAPRGTVPRDLKFADKTTFASHLAAMEAWLANPDNRGKGQIYGIVSEQYRKLMQIPVGLERSAVRALFREAITGGFADEFSKSGLPSLKLMGKKVREVAGIISRWDETMRVSGRKWSTALAEFAGSLGMSYDQAFVERVWDPLMRTWNFFDVSERNKLGTPEEGDLFARIEAAFPTFAGIPIDGEAKRAKLRGAMMATIEAERTILNIHENNPGLKVRDDDMGFYRRLISHGLVTGRRQVARHMDALFLRMNPAWSDTAPVGNDSSEDQRAFWEAAADLYGSDRAAFEARMDELFPANVMADFAEPIATNNAPVFEVVEDGLARQASLARVREAWTDSAGETGGKRITLFAETLHRIEGGKPGGEGATVQRVLGAFRKIFGEIKADRDERRGVEMVGRETLPRQLMDARRAQNWPAEFVSYATYDETSNLVLLHQLALHAALGADPIGPNSELMGSLRAAQDELKVLWDQYDEMVRAGVAKREIEARMGKDTFFIARNAPKTLANLNRIGTAFRQMASTTNYLAGDFRAINEMLGFTATMMLQNPRSGMINIIGDMLGLLSSLKLSSPALKGLRRAVNSLAADFGNGMIESFGQNAVFNVENSERRLRNGVADADNYTSWREKTNNYGPRNALAAPSGPETTRERIGRTITSVLSRARSIVPNLGSPVRPDRPLAPKPRWGFFPNTALSTMNANIDAAKTVFEDVAVRGVEYLKGIPVTERAAFVRELELGLRDIDGEQLGYHGGWLLNDAAAFATLKNAIETKFAGESTVGRFVAKAWRRFESAGEGEWNAISDAQFTDIVNYANTEWTLQANFSNLPHWMTGPLRPLFTFLTWPYMATRRFGKQFLDPDGRLIWWGANSTVADGMKAFFVVAAPATIAGSFAIDWYDKYLLGKKQNLRETGLATALPVIGAFADPAAFVERVGRYGSAGFATDLLNQIVNFDSQRNLSLDNRIVAVNALSSLINSLTVTPVQQGGNITWASVGRPFFQSVGGGGVLQYLQLAQNFLGLNNQDAAVNARINTGNYLRAAGRELGVQIRVFQGASFAPTPVTPYLQQMELAALVNNTELFREAQRAAVRAAREDGPPSAQASEDAARKYVADQFADRHPLRRLFRTAPTESDYRKMLGLMDSYGAGQVRQAVNSYNRYLTNWFGKKAYYGRADENTTSVEDLIRAASRINEAR